jgi:hypothetical protein
VPKRLHRAPKKPRPPQPLHQQQTASAPGGVSLSLRKCISDHIFDWQQIMLLKEKALGYFSFKYIRMNHGGCA